MPIDILLESSPKGHFFYKPKGRIKIPLTNKPSTILFS